MQTKQFLIRFRLLESETERRYNRDSLRHLELSQIAWWDETHRKYLIGGISGKKELQLRFKRNSEGLLDENGTYKEQKFIKLNVKYENEGQFGLGCAKVIRKNNNPKNLPSGVTCKRFFYLGKLLISLKDFNSKLNLEIKRIASLLTKTVLLYIKNKKELYQNQGVDKLPGLGKKGKESFAKAGIKTLGELCDMPVANFDKIEKISEEKVEDIVKLANEKVKKENIQPDIDYEK